MRSKRQYATIDDTDRLDMGHGHTAAGHIRRFATMTRATSNRDFGFACHFRKFCYTGWWLVENLAILMDGTTSCATYYLRILSSFHKIRVKILPFFFFTFILCYPRGSMIRFIVPNFSKSFYENARETGWFIHLKAVLIEKNFAFGLYSD